MIVDNQFLFSSSHELLTEVCAFNQALDNRILSLNEGPFWEDFMESFNELKREEIRMYKCFDC